MRLGELQVDPKQKTQLLYSIQQMLKAEPMTYPTLHPLSSKQDLFINKWRFRRCTKFKLIDEMPDGEEKEKEADKFWWSIETDCFTCVFGDEIKEYLARLSMDLFPDQVVIKREDNSEDRLQEDSSSSEDEDETEEEEKEIDNNENDSSNSYSSALTTMDWGLRSHPDYLLLWGQWGLKSYGWQ